MRLSLHFIVPLVIGWSVAIHHGDVVAEASAMREPLPLAAIESRSTTRKGNRVVA